MGQVDGVLTDGVGDVDHPNDVDELGDQGRVGHGGDRVERAGRGMLGEHLHLGPGVGVAHRHPGHEAVSLRLGEGVGAFHLDRVLRGDHHEGRGEVVGRGVDGDLTLLHALEQRRLGLR